MDKTNTGMNINKLLHAQIATSRNSVHISKINLHIQMLACMFKIDAPIQILIPIPVAINCCVNE
jgi:hypothetical protein